MPRNPDFEFRDKVLNFIKSEWLKNGKMPVALSLKDIAVGIGEDPDKKGEKIWQYVNKLENSDKVKVTHGEGSQTNTYEFINENIAEKLTETREQMIDSIDEIVKELNEVSSKTVNLFTQISKQNITYLGEIADLKQAIISLESWGIANDGCPLFKSKKGSNITLILEKLSKEENH